MIYIEEMEKHFVPKKNTSSLKHNETDYLLSSSANSKRLMESIKGSKKRRKNFSSVKELKNEICQLIAERASAREIELRP